MLIEHARLYEASRELSVLEERNRLARELHDALTQSLFGLRLRLEAGDVERRRPASSKRSSPSCGRSSSSSARRRWSSTGSCRASAKHLDVVGRTHGLEVGLRRRAASGALDPDVEQALFRIAQEAVTNAVRHAAATRVVVRLDRAGEPVTLEVQDDGRGFDPLGRAVSARRLGLVSMRERADGARRRRSPSSPSRAAGTLVRAEVPAVAP